MIVIMLNYIPRQPFGRTAVFTQGKTGKLEQPAYKTWFERGFDSHPCDKDWKRPAECVINDSITKNGVLKGHPLESELLILLFPALRGWF